MREVRRLLPALAVVACTGGDPAVEPGPSPSSAVAGPVFSEVAAESGIDFVHRHYGTGRRYMPETMGSGGGWLDYDGDGWPDVVLIDGGRTPGYDGPVQGPALYRNLGDGRFAPRTRQAGLAHAGYGMGLSAADVDGDGDVDLYLTGLGDEALLVNRGDGTFVDATASAGVARGDWSTSAAFGDLDGDGDLDLYVVGYVDFTWATHKICGDARFGFEAYCHPDVYDGLPDRLYLNRGRGDFVDATDERLGRDAEEWRRTGKGLGVVVTDIDGDGDQDVYVANDSTANTLWINDGEGRFEDAAVASGLAFNEDGESEAGMGVAIDDLDGDGRPEIFVTNLDLETNTLYAGAESGFFVGRTFQSGLGPPSWLKVGFGTVSADLDADGLPDLAVANGHIIDNIGLRRDDITHAQPNQLFVNRGGLTFVDASSSAGTPFVEPTVGRGLSAADYDRDGDVDLLFTTNGGPPLLARNDTSPRRHWLGVVLRGAGANRDALGAKVAVEGGGRIQRRERRSSSSYLSQSEAALHFGLADGDAESVSVHWPGGRRQRFLRPGGDRYLVLAEGR